MIASLLLVGILIQGETPVTFTEPAAPLKRLMPKIAEACHVTYKVHPIMENEVLCISVHDVPAKYLLARIAAATGGAWVTEKDGIYLEPNSAARSAISARAAIKKTARVQHFIDIFEKVQAEDWDPKSTQKDQEVTKDSRVHLLYRLASIIGARAISAIPPGGRIVYSSSPTNGQVALSADVATEVAAFRKDYGQRRRTREATDPQPEPAVAKINAIVAYTDGTVSYGANSLTVGFVLYDSKGAVLSQESEQLDNDDIDAPGPPNTKPEPPLELSAGAKQLLKFVSVDFQHETNGMRPEAIEKLLSPDKVDPLAYPGEWLVGAAKQRGLQLVASLPDDVYNWFGDGSDIKFPKDVFDRMSKDLSIVEEQKDDWLTVSPAAFLFEPIDRSALKQLASAYNAKIDITLPDLLQLAAAGVGTAHGNMTQVWLGDVCPMVVDLIDKEDWDLLRLCAKTPDVTLQKLLGGGAGTVIELGASGQDNANSFVFEAGPGNPGLDLALLRVDPTQGPGEPTPLPTDSESPDDYRAEPTEVIPNGLPNSAPIKVVTENETVMRPAGQNTYSGEQQSEMAGSTAEELAQEAAVVNRDYDHPPYRITSIDYDHELTLYKAVQLGTRTTYHFRIYATPEVFKESKIVIPSFPSKETCTLQTLPEQLQTAFDEAVKEAKLNAKRQQDRDAKNQKSSP